MLTFYESTFSRGRHEPLYVDGRLTGPQTGPLTGGLKISKSFIHRRFRGRTGGLTKLAVCPAQPAQLLRPTRPLAPSIPKRINIHRFSCLPLFPAFFFALSFFLFIFAPSLSQPTRGRRAVLYMRKTFSRSNTSSLDCQERLPLRIGRRTDTYAFFVYLRELRAME